MRIEALDLAGTYLLVPEPISDKRGFFARSFSAEQLAAEGLVTQYPEWSLSFNRKRDTLRGLHWQADPQETKLVQCISGAIFDVIVDMRPDSQSFGQWASVPLNAENRHMLYVPAGFAHGFQTLTANAEIYYHISETFRPEGARGVRWNDGDIGIAWPDASERIVSERDAALPLLRDIEAKG
jgi:dTDP-4-dehydrorhamnose 3,5-epimerase